jgi:Cu/Ag efflux pump CusA
LTALATGLALVPLVLGGTKAGYEIEHPLAVVILGGLVTSTLLNLAVVSSSAIGGNASRWQWRCGPSMRP